MNKITAGEVFKKHIPNLTSGLEYFFDEILASMEEYASLQSSGGMSQHDAQCILNARDSLIKGDKDDAYHWLYKIASPKFDKMSEDVWSGLEKIAAGESTTVEGDGWISVEDSLPEYWKPNEFGKKKVNWVLIINKHQFQFIGFYTKGHEVEYGDDDYDGEYDEVEEKKGTLYLKAGFYEIVETPGGVYDERYNKLQDITHWHPLLSPPKSINNGK